MPLGNMGTLMPQNCPNVPWGRERERGGRERVGGVRERVREGGRERERDRE
jgi:hypothetical protein